MRSGADSIPSVGEGAIPRVGMRRADRYVPGRHEATRRVTGRLWRYLAVNRVALAAGLFLTAAAAGAGSAAPYFIGRAVDDGITAGNPGLFGQFALFLLACMVGNAVLTGISSRILGKTSEMVMARFRLDLFRATQRLDMRRLDRHPVGDLLSRLVNDTELVDRLLSIGLAQVAYNVFTLGSVVVAVFLLDWRLALACIGLALPALLAVRVMGRLARQVFRITRRTMSEVSARLEEDISGVRTTQALNAVEDGRERFRERNERNREANVRAVGLTGAFVPAMNFVATVAVAAVVLLGGWLALRMPPLLTLGTLIAAVAYVRLLFNPLQDLAGVYADIQAAMAGAERVLEVIDQEPEIVEHRDAESLEAFYKPAGKGAVTFDEVRFSYDARSRALNGVSFDIAPGEFVALVGPNGAGKSTIGNLLLRFYDVDSGGVRLDGVDVRDLTLASLRHQIALIPQEPFLFSGTVRENLVLAKPDASDADVARVVDLVGASRLIAGLSGSYEHQIGERGRGLSRGQRQLLSLARALLGSPKVLVLDEVNASMDRVTQNLVERAIARLRSSCTIILIAHRLSMVKGADRIIVLDEGRVESLGRHEELLAVSPLYAQLWGEAE